MSRPVLPPRSNGFTLIELLIVVVVIAILALIVIPRVMGASRKAEESTLKNNLQEIRSALEQFQSDTGVYPNSLMDLIDAQAAPPITGENGVGGTGVAIPSGSYKGPYLIDQGGIDGCGIPVNPFAPTISVIQPLSQADCDASWTYSQGIVHCTTPGSGNTMDGIPYQQL